MDAIQNVVILMIAGTVIWSFLKLKDRIEFLEQEVRWLRAELNNLKPGGYRGEYD